MTADKERCLLRGMDDYLAKPVELPQLAAVLEKWIPDRSPIEKVQSPLMVSASGSAPVFDESGLMGRLMGDRELAGSVVRGFVEHAPAQFEQLSARIEEGDAAGTRLQAHTLKGSAATVAAEALRIVAAEMESSAAAKQLDCCREYLASANLEFNRFKTMMESVSWYPKSDQNTKGEEMRDVRVRQELVPSVHG